MTVVTGADVESVWFDGSSSRCLFINCILKLDDCDVNLSGWSSVAYSNFSELTIVLFLAVRANDI